MKTVLLPRDEQGLPTLCLKAAEEPRDFVRLTRLRANLARLRGCVPEMAPEILEEGPESILFIAWTGATFNSEQAPPIYESQPWILDSVLVQLDRLQACVSGSRLAAGDRLGLLRQLVRPLRSGLVLPWIVQRHFVPLLISQRRWVLTHGDLTEWNIVVDQASHSTALIDWEALAFRPRYYDEFALAFHRCTPVYDMTWQRTLLSKRFLSLPHPFQSASSNHAVAVAALCFHYWQDVRRVRAAKDATEPRRRLAIRYENLAHLADRSHWERWLGWLLD
jgi:hypothetical protein